METSTETRTIPLYQKISRTLAWQKTVSQEWRERADDRLASCQDELPSGSGIDSGSIILETSAPERIRIRADFHHMDENGYYDGWTEHVITIRPSLANDYTISVSGRNRNQIKDYLWEVFDAALRRNVAEY